MPQCPKCNHKWTTRKAAPTRAPYLEAVVTFTDDVFLVVGGYGATDADMREKAIYRRALALSGGRLLNRLNLAYVPNINSINRYAGAELEGYRMAAMAQRAQWGACIDAVQREAT